MPEPNKLEVYRLLYRLNRTFGLIVRHLMELEPMRRIPAKDMRMFRASVQEQQAEINDMVLDSLQPIEMHDSARFELRDPERCVLTSLRTEESKLRDRRTGRRAKSRNVKPLVAILTSTNKRKEKANDCS